MVWYDPISRRFRREGCEECGWNVHTRNTNGSVSTHGRAIANNRRDTYPPIVVLGFLDPYHRILQPLLTFWEGEIWISWVLPTNEWKAEVGL